MQFRCTLRDESFEPSQAMIGQYLPQTNEKCYSVVQYQMWHFLPVFKHLNTAHDFGARCVWTAQSMMRTGWRLRWRIFLAEERTEQLEDEPIQCASLVCTARERLHRMNIRWSWCGTLLEFNCGPRIQMKVLILWLMKPWRTTPQYC